MADSTRRGVMLVIASPSGAGKSSTTRRLLSENPNLSMSVSVTTRPKRDGEEEGADDDAADGRRGDDLPGEQAGAHGREADADDDLEDAGDDEKGAHEMLRWRGAQRRRGNALPSVSKTCSALVGAPRRTVWR